MGNEPVENTRRHAITVISSRVFARSRLAVTGMAMVAALFVVSAVPASAATLTWNTTSGTWDLSALNWDPGAVAWTQTGTTAPLHDAVFGGTDGTYAVTLAGSQIAASNLTFNASGYTLSGTSLFLGSGTVTVASGTATISSVVRGTSGLTKAGAGTLTLSAANTFSGGVKLTSGTLLVGNAGALGSNLVDINGGSLGTSVASALNITTGSFRFSNDFSAPVFGSGQLSLSAPITLSNGTRTINVVSGAGFNLYGGISDGGNGYGLIKTGNSLMRLGGTNTYTGDTRVEAGTLSIFSDLALQNSTLDTNGLGTFAFTASGPTPTIGGLKGSRNTTINAGVVAITLNPAQGVSNAYSGVIGGTTSIIKINAGTQVLAGANTYSGSTTINAGVLGITSSNGLGFGGATFLNQGAAVVSVIPAGSGVTEATLDLSGNITVNEVINLTGTTNTAKLINSAVGTSVVLDNGVAFANFSNAGSNFSLADRNKQLTLSGGGASGATVAISALATTQSTFSVVSGGTGWAVGNTVTISGGGSTTSAVYNVSGTGANGSITALTLTTPGIGFTSLTGLTYTGAKGTATPAFSGTNFTFSSTDGTLAVGSITVGAAGSGYTANPAISSSFGSGFSGTTTIASVTLAGAKNEIGGEGNLTIKSAINQSESGAGFTKTGGGILTLSASNAYTGTTAINGGWLAAGHASALGNGGDIRFTGGTLRYTADSAGQDWASRIKSSGSAISIDTNAQSVTYAGVIDNTNTGGLTLNDSNATKGRLTLSAANTFSGTTTVTSGTLRLSNSLALQNSVLGTGGTGLVFDSAVSSRAFTVAGLSGSADLTLTDSGVNAIALSVGNADVSSSYSGSLTGVGSLVKIGAGVLTLSGNNSHSGGTTISAGTLRMGSATALGASTGALVVNGGTLDMNGFSESVGTFSGSSGATVTSQSAATLTASSAATSEYAGLLSGAIAFTKQGSGLLTFSGSNSYGGGTWINAGTLRAGNASGFGTGAITLASGATLDLNNFSIANTITNNGGTITGASSFTGTTQLTSGSTTLSNIGGTVDIDASAVANLSGTIDATVIVKNGGRGRAAGQIRKSVTVNAGAHFDILDGASIDEGASFTFANNGQIHVDRATNLTLSKVITGSGGLRKSNTGKLILTGSHDYSGNTLVEQGAFAVNGSLSGSGTVTIKSGATLMGSGTINGPTIVEGIHSPGNSPGLETFTNGLTYGASSVLVWELSANTDSLADRGTLYDGIVLTGGALNVTSGATVNLVFNAALASGSASVVNWSDAFWDVSRTWRILEVGSSATWNAGTFSLGSVGLDASGASLASVRGDASFNVSHDQDGSVYVNYVIVPEPGTVIFAGVGIAMLWAVSAARGRRRA